MNACCPVEELKESTKQTEGVRGAESESLRDQQCCLQYQEFKNFILSARESHEQVLSR